MPPLGLELNPLAQTVGSARILRNFIPDKERLLRQPFSGFLGGSTIGWPSIGHTWHLIDFHYTRAGAPENKLLMFASNGHVYQKQESWIIEIFPGNTGFSVLTKKPFVGQLSNRLFWSDGISSYVYDGRSVRVWGLTRSTTAPTVTAANVTGSIVAATGVKGCFSWVVLDEAGNRVHESSRSNINASFVVIGGADDAVTLDITGLTAPSGATHWSGYISELDGSEVYRRTNTTLLTTFTYTATAFPASTTPKAPIRNDPPPSSTVGCVAKNRIFLRDDANPNTWYFSALGEVKGLLNGAADESFCGYSTNSISDISNSDFLPDREIRAMSEHENAIFIFSEQRGYAVIGELNLLDNRSPRSIVKLQQFTEGCIGAWAIKSTPRGLAWMNPSKKIWLWPGGSELYDIGEPIQKQLNVIHYSKELATSSSTSFRDVVAHWHSANGRQWLIWLIAAEEIDDSGDANAEQYQRCEIYDFSRQNQRATKATPEPGSWFEWAAYSNSGFQPDCMASITTSDGFSWLVIGEDGGELRVHDVIAQPAHLNLSMILGQTYLGSAVVGHNPCIFRTGLLRLGNGQWVVGSFLEMITGTDTFVGVPSTGTFTEPTITRWTDVEDGDNPGSGTALTLDTALSSADKRAWFASNGGSMGEHSFSNWLMQAARIRTVPLARRRV